MHVIVVHKFIDFDKKNVSTFYFVTQLQLVQATASSAQIFFSHNVYCHEKCLMERVFSDRTRYELWACLKK